MTQLVAYLLLFLAVSLFFVFIHLVLGRFIRPVRPHAEKLTIYECGEPTIGSAWIQFDLRYYVVALLFVIFDVEVAFFFPWAVVFGQANALAKASSAELAQSPNASDSVRAKLAHEELLKGSNPVLTESEEQSQRAGASRFAKIALMDILVFFGVLLVGFAYLWKRGDLTWVRSTAMERAIANSPYQRPPGEPVAREVLIASEKV